MRVKSALIQGVGCGRVLLRIITKGDYYGKRLLLLLG